MPTPPRVILASENLQLGGLLAVALARLHRSGDLQLAAIWSNTPDKRHPPLAGKSHAALEAATTVQRHNENEGVLLGGVYVADYAQLAQELNVEYRHVPDVSARHVAATVSALNIDLGVVCGHSQYFRRPLRNAAKLGWVNCHPSLLPKHRGPYPAFWELRNGDTESGISLHKLWARFDEGPLLAQFPIPLEPGVTFSEIVRRQGEVCGRDVPSAVMGYVRGELTPTAQPPGGSYEPAPSGEDFVLDPSMTCDAIGRFIVGMRTVGPVLVRVDGTLLIAENATSWQSYPTHRDGTFATPKPEKPRMIGRERLEFPAADGLITLLVRTATPADLGQGSMN